MDMPPRCPVCGAADLRCDEVFDTGPLQLLDCRRCEHRWTSRTPAPTGALTERARRLTRPTASRSEAVASAA